MKKIIKYLKCEEGILRLSGGCARIALIIFGAGFIIGLLMGIFSDDWYIAYASGLILGINLIINLIRFVIDKIKLSVSLPQKVIKWLKTEKKLSDFFIRNNYFGDDALSSINRENAKKEYLEYVKKNKLK